MTTEERNQLIMENLGLIGHVMNKSGARRRNHDLQDDLFQEGVFGLSDALRDFNPDAGTQFSTYAYWKILNRLQRAELKLRTPCCSLDEDQAGTLLADDYVAPISVSWDELYHVMQSHLSSRELIILTRLYRDNWLLRQVAEEVGVTKERVRQIKFAALEKLRGVVREE